MPVCFFSRYQFLAASGSLYFWEGCWKAEYRLLFTILNMAPWGQI